MADEVHLIRIKIGGACLLEQAPVDRLGDALRLSLGLIGLLVHGGLPLDHDAERGRDGPVDTREHLVGRSRERPRGERVELLACLETLEVADRGVEVHTHW